MALDSDAPFPFYADKLGAPLQGGSVYFGTSGQNPITSPITVYWDQAGTQPAAQPIAVSNGVTTRNGAPTRIWISGDFSRMVLDSKGRQVIYEATPPSSLRAQLAASFGATLIGWIRAAAGAVLRLVSDKLSDIVSVKDFGAKGDGATDDTAAIQAAITYAVSVATATGGQPMVAFPTGVYKVTSTITLTRNIKLIGLGFPIIKAFHSGDVIQAIGIPDSVTFPDNKVIIEGLSFKNDAASTPASFIRLGTANSLSPTYVQSVADAEINSCYFQNCTATYLIDNNRGFGLSISKCIFSAYTATAALKLRQTQTELPYWSYSVNLFSNDFTNATGKAIEADGGDLSIFGGIMEGCSQGAVDVGVLTTYTGSQPVSFHGTYFEQNSLFHFRANSARVVANFIGCKFVGGGTGNKLLLVSSMQVSFYNCSSPNSAPAITGGGNVRQYGCTYMASAVDSTVDSFRSDRATIFTTTSDVAATFGPLLPSNGGLGGGSALVLCSHSTGGVSNCVSELFLIRMGVNGNAFAAQSVSRLSGTDVTTFAFSADANGNLQVTASAAGNAKYEVIHQTNGNYLP